MIGIKRVGLAVGVAAALTAAAPGAHAERVLGRELRPTVLNALNGTVVWSRWVERLHAYRLVGYRAGRAEVLPVPPSPIPFRADLGLDEHGALVAAYARCDRGCDVFEYHFATRRERRLGAVSKPHQDELLPSVWGSKIAFLRYQHDRRRGGFVAIKVADLRSGRVWRIARGTIPAGHAFHEGPLSIDLRGRRVAFLWSVQSEFCGSGSLAVGAFNHLWVRPLGGRRRQIEGGCAYWRDEFSPVSLLGDQVFYSLAAAPDTTDHQPRVRLYDIAGRTYGDAPAKSRGAVSDGRYVYYTRRVSGPRRHEIVQAGMPAFTPSRPADRPFP